MSVKCFSPALATVAVLGLATCSQAAVTVLDFEDLTDVTTKLTTVSNTGTATYINANTPSEGTNSIKPSGGDASAFYNGGTFSLAIGDSISVSIDLTKGSPSGASQVLAQVGFGDTLTNSFVNSAAGDSIFSRILVDTYDSVTPANSTYKQVYNYKLSGAVGQETASSSGFTIAGGNNFFLYNLTLTRTGQSTFTQTGGLSQAGVTKTSYTSGTETNPGLGIAADNNGLYAGFRSTSSATTLRLDNFTITPTPEPAALGLIGLAGVALGKRRRR